MEKPRIRHIAINVEDLDKTAEYYKRVFGMEEKHRRPGGTIYLSDGHLDLALIHSEKYPWGIHHFGFKVDSVQEIEKIADTKAEASREHDPRLIVAAVHVQARDRPAGVRTGVAPVRDHKRVADDHRARGYTAGASAPGAVSVNS